MVYGQIINAVYQSLKIINNIMRKFLVLSTLFVLSLVSCQREETNQLVINNQEIITEIYAQQYGNGGTNLYPSWILQVDGVREYYKSISDKNTSTEALDYIFNDNLLVKIRHNRQPKEIVIQQQESIFNQELSTHLFLVPGNGDILTYSIPVAWKYDEILKNERSTPVALRWNVLIDGKVVQTYKRTFNMRELHNVGFQMFFTNEEVDLYSKIGTGAFLLPPKNDKGETVYRQVAAFAMGMIDEHSTALSDLRKEILEDMDLHMNILVDKVEQESGEIVYSPVGFIGAQADQEKNLERELKALAYGLFSKNINYSMAFSTPLQYIRGAEEIFSTKQAYCAEIAALTASFLKALGYDVIYDVVPGHAINRVFLDYEINREDKVERVQKVIDIDMTIWLQLQYTMWVELNKTGKKDPKEIFSIVGKVEGMGDMNMFDALFLLFEVESSLQGQGHNIGRKETEFLYGELNVIKAREFLSPLSRSTAYYATKSAAAKEKVAFRMPL